MVKRRPTTNPYLTAIITAQEINRAAGGSVISPWEVWQLPDDWLDTFDALANEYPALQAGQAKVDAKLAEVKGRGKSKTT